MRSTTRIAIVVTAMMILASPSSGQLPPKTRYVASWWTGNPMPPNPSTSGTLAAFDAGGGLLTTVALPPPAVYPQSVSMSPTNDRVVIWDQASGLFQYDPTNGALLWTSLNSGGGQLNDGCIHEDGGMLWLAFVRPTGGRVYRSVDLRGALATIVFNDALGMTAICWNGSTGGFCTAEVVMQSPAGVVRFHARDGTVVHTIRQLDPVMALHWNPWDGNVYAAQNPAFQPTGRVVRFSQNGTHTTLGWANPAVEFMTGLRAMEQPRNLLLCCEGGTRPHHLATFDPASASVTTLYRSTAYLPFSDAAVFQSRKVWASGGWFIGIPGVLAVNFGATRALRRYQIGLSFGHAPGIPVPGVGEIHLRPDHLFVASLWFGPPLFNHFNGRLDSQGRAIPAPSVAIPPDPALRGLRIYGAAVTYSASGISDISNCWGITIR